MQKPILPFSMMTETCFNKCVDNRYKESEVNMGENSCIDHWVSKYWHSSHSRVHRCHRHFYNNLRGGASNSVNVGYNKGSALGPEIIGTFLLVYTVFTATYPKRSARDSHVPVLAPLPIGFVDFMVHLASVPITGTGINPARTFGAADIYNHAEVWDDQWIFFLSPENVN